MGVSTIPAGGGGGLQPKYQKFTSSGTFTLPDGYGAAKPLVITIQVIGGGGAGTGSLAVGAITNGLAVRLDRMDYFGQSHGTFPVNVGASYASNANRDYATNQNGWGGGSGGIAQTQMALTGPLTITVGAAGARSTASNTANMGNFYTTSWGRSGSNNTGVTAFNVSNLSTGGTKNMNAGGSGGMSTAGAVSATGGSGGGSGTFDISTSGTVQFPSDTNINATNAIGPFNVVPTVSFAGANGSNGAAGSPAGSAGSATPLLGALAGGSGTTTPVYGAFGVGGIKTDVGTSTGVEGTGGGYGSIGASGAVIISYWA